jgi:hypothetical protein
MYNLTFNNPYNRDIVKKLDGFRNKQQGYFVPTYIEPEHITHQYDPITITGGARAIQAPRVGSRALSLYPPDLFEPKYTINRNQMCGNRLKGGASDFQRDTFYQPTTFNSGIASYDSDSDVDDLGKVHANRRGKRGMVSGGYTTGLAPVTKDVIQKVIKSQKMKRGGNQPHAKGLAPISNDILEKFKKIKGGKKPKKEKESKPSSKLLKIFN